MSWWLSILVGAAFAAEPDLVSLQTAAAEIAKEFERDVAKTTIRSVGIGGACRRMKAFDSEALDTHLQQTWLRVEHTLSAPELAPLLEYTRARWPTAPPAESGDLAECHKGFAVVSAQTQASVVATVTRILDSLKALPSLALPLGLRSTPPGAQVTLRPAAGAASPLENTTDSDFDIVYRGIYVLTMRLDGHADGMLRLDLVNQSPKAVACNFSSSVSTCQTVSEAE